MLSTLVNTKLGARFRCTVLDQNDNVKEQGQWHDNMIMDVATTLMSTGFEEEPIPKVGSSIAEVVANQNGVQAGIEAMILLSKKELWAGRFTRVNNNSANMSWGTQYTYRNNGVANASVSEIGIDNFNRAIFLDEVGMARSWVVSPNEKLVVDMEFVISFTTPTTAINITTVDNEGTAIESLNVNLTVANQATTGTPLWWKLLSKPTTRVGLIKDATYTGVTAPSADKIDRVNITNDYIYEGRDVKINITHRAGEGGQSYKGMLIEFGCLAPAFGVVFSKTIRVGSGYTFKSNMTVTW